MASELKPCPFCRKPMMLREALWPSEGDTDAIIHADKTDCPMFGFGDGSADGSIVEKWNICSSDDEDDFPSDGSCIRCGSVPRNASGLCNTCLDEDAARLENTRPAPTATDTGLVRYDLSMFGNGIVEMGGGAYVRADQAVELLAAERAEKEELRRAIMGEEPDPDLQHGNFLEMAATLHLACDGARKRAEYAEQRLGQSEAELKQARADNAAKDAAIAELVHDLNRIKDHETELVNDNAAQAERIKELDRCHEGTIDLCNQKTAQIEALEAKLAAAEKALTMIANIELSFPEELRDIARAVLGGKPSC